LIPGDIFDIRITIAVVDGSANVVVANIGRAYLICDCQ